MSWPGFCFLLRHSSIQIIWINSVIWSKANMQPVIFKFINLFLPKHPLPGFKYGHVKSTSVSRFIDKHHHSRYMLLIIFWLVCHGLQSTPRRFKCILKWIACNIRTAWQRKCFNRIWRESKEMLMTNNASKHPGGTEYVIWFWSYRSETALEDHSQ
jgi:hypothetical protein